MQKVRKATSFVEVFPMVTLFREQKRENAGQIARRFDYLCVGRLS